MGPAGGGFLPSIVLSLVSRYVTRLRHLRDQQRFASSETDEPGDRIDLTLEPHGGVRYIDRGCHFVSELSALLEY